MQYTMVPCLICLIFFEILASGAVRPIPPPGASISDSERADLSREAVRLGREIEDLQRAMKGNATQLLPDAEIFHKAINDALAHNEIFNVTNEIPAARRLLKLGFERAEQLREGNPTWNSATGLVVRAYVSRIDGSVQPYGLVVPPTFSPNNGHRYRLDVWFHGRDERLSELNFVTQRLRSAGEFTPPNTIVLHPYGRYCNANKFAGEVDLFEALDDIRKHYLIDEDRILVRGFSMGGAACWQFATHYAGLWAAAAPGAGFAESAKFLNLPKDPAPPWYEQKLWHLYDSTDYAANLFNCPLVAYSGEIDKQKQAADLMAEALKAEGIEMAHIIGPDTPHRFHPQSKEEINRRIDGIALRGREPVPREVRFTTWTMRYNKMNWITVDGLQQHWERARVNAELDPAANRMRVVTTNVSALTLEFPAGLYPLDVSQRPVVMLDNQKIEVPRPLSDRSWKARFARHASKWIAAPDLDQDIALRKRHGLQGPIDDAFMDSFLVVRPTGEPLNSSIANWVAGELMRATNEWRRQFRGEARAKDDRDVSEHDIAEHNLILWGDPSSNQMIGKIANRLPLQWRRESLTLGGTNVAAAGHVPILIYPNPLNPRRYVVLNSGPTFREADYLNNARQIPRLPDYAIIDISQPPDAYAPGKVVHAGFFDEQWKLSKPQ